MDEDVEQPIGDKPIRTHKPDLRFQTELVDQICHMFTMEGVRPTHVREIMPETYMFDIWRRHPHDTRPMMR